MKTKKSFLLFLYISICSSCTKSCSDSKQTEAAEQVLRSYMELAFSLNKIEDKENLIKLTGGELKVAIASASSQNFKEAYLSQRYSLDGFSIIERRDLTPIKTMITYQLQYKESSQTNAEDAYIVAENTVLLEKNNDKWLIYRVLSNSTSIEFPLAKI